jgi:hypothetical protein
VAPLRLPAFQRARGSAESLGASPNRAGSWKVGGRRKVGRNSTFGSGHSELLGCGSQVSTLRQPRLERGKRYLTMVFAFIRKHCECCARSRVTPRLANQGATNRYTRHLGILGRSVGMHGLRVWGYSFWHLTFVKGTLPIWLPLLDE